MHFCHKAPGVISLFRGEGYIMALEKSLLACCAEVTLLLEKKKPGNYFMFPCQLGAELGVRAISHLEEISDEGIQAMSVASVIAVLLPTTAYILRLKCPPARAMIDSG